MCSEECRLNVHPDTLSRTGTVVSRVMRRSSGLAMAASMFFLFGSGMGSAAEPVIMESQDRRSFKTIPSNPAPSATERRELERLVGLCMKTVEREVPGGHFHANVDGSIVNTIGIDRERFKFWKCMSENGRSLAPIKK